MHNSSHLPGRLKWEDAKVGMKVIFAGYKRFPELDKHIGKEVEILEVVTHSPCIVVHPNYVNTNPSISSTTPHNVAFYFAKEEWDVKISCWCSINTLKEKGCTCKENKHASNSNKEDL